MINSNLIAFQKKHNLDDFFMEIVSSFFDKLVSFGYIGNMQKNRLILKLDENVDYVILGTQDIYDYKSGYYDADKKTLYIKEPNNISAVYLRVLYAICTTEVSLNHHNIAFATAKLGSTNYKLYHENFAINRAVLANIVCRLLGTSTNTDTTAFYKTYSHNFLGFEISSDNDIYALEGKVLSQMCFALGIDEQIIYTALFSNDPIKSLNRIFYKVSFDESDKFLKAFDKTSRLYSNYCKLTHLAKTLNLNYVELKKNVLNESFDNLKLERTKIIAKARDILSKMQPKNSGDLYSDEGLDLNLAETLENLEKDITKQLTATQSILASKIVTSISYLSSYQYASKLKQFNDMLIFPNKKIDDAIYNNIVYNLMPDGEITVTNIIQKIRYSLINHVLFSDKFTDVSKRLGFYANINDINPDSTCSYVFVTVNGRFSHLVEVNSLNKTMKQLKDNCNITPTDNLRYLMNSDYSNLHIHKIEKIVSSLKSSYTELKGYSLDNMFLFNINNKDYLIVDTTDKLLLFIVEYKNASYLCSQMELSDYFSLFYNNAKKGESDSLLPTMYKNKKNIFSK
ncbi:MAG: hypothetical protein PHR25_01325 [Clostridia bacterium]|nr:hypothetical protein [Clostridia bacterium]MDD4375408.1 hypothetical protein [Clostridia bacterium]